MTLTFVFHHIIKVTLLKDRNYHAAIYKIFLKQSVVFQHLLFKLNGETLVFNFFTKLGKFL